MNVWLSSTTMFYVISPSDPTDWHVDRQTLIELLEHDFPGIDVSIAANGPTARDVVWRLQMPEGELEGIARPRGAGSLLGRPSARCCSAG
jgi:hypothetical protein